MDIKTARKLLSLTYQEKACHESHIIKNSNDGTEIVKEINSVNLDDVEVVEKLCFNDEDGDDAYRIVIRVDFGAEFFIMFHAYSNSWHEEWVWIEPVLVEPIEVTKIEWEEVNE